MDNYLSEREQWEMIKAWIRSNGLWILAGIAIGALGVGGLNWYRAHVDDRGAQANAKYGEILDAFDKGDRTHGLVLLGELERDYGSSPYVDQAKLAAARFYVEADELDKAAGELQAVADHSKDAELGTIARMRLARVQIAQGKPDVALATLNAIHEPGAFASSLHEVRGDAYFAKSDKAGALKEYLAAKTGNVGGPPDAQLDLKITDLSAESTRVATGTPALTGAAAPIGASAAISTPSSAGAPAPAPAASK
ncbi:MAG TPA: tetratricopeptide repeat protein [Steroidobacteraceae bacterium]|nr:tetratricopeptide repeat protein [Steroidobacteraceae bacterium]